MTSPDKRVPVDDLPLFFCEFQQNGTLTAVNLEYCTSLGRRSDEMLGQSFLSFLPENERDAAQSTLVGLTPEHPTALLNCRMSLPSGPVWHEWRIRAFFKSVGEPWRYQAVGADITRHKQAEESLNIAVSQLEEIRRISSLDQADIKNVSDIILDTIVRITHSPYGFFGYLSDDEAAMTIHAWSGKAMKDCAMTDKPACFLIREAGIWGEAVRRREPLVLNDYGALHPAKKGLPPGHVELTRLLVVPFLSQGQIRSVAAVANRTMPYEQADVIRLRTFLDSIQTITDSKRTEAALLESEARHRALIEGLPDIIMRFDRDGRHIFASNRVKEVTSIPARDFVGKTHRDLGFTESQCEFWEGALRQVFTSGQAHEETFSFTAPSGDVVIYNWRLIPEFDLAGQVRSVLTISRDITRQQKTEQAYQTLFREMLDGFALHEIICSESGEPVDYRFLSVNPAFERMTGLRGEAIVGRTVLELMPRTERHWIEAYGRVALSGEPCHIENYAREIDKYFEVTAFCPSPGQFATIFTDITSRKKSEKQLADSHKLLRNLADLVPGVIYQYRLYPDGHSCFPYASPGMYDIYELTPEEVLEDATAVFGRLHPDDREMVTQAIIGSARSQEMFYTEFRVLLPRQGLQWRWSQARPQLMEDGSTLWHGIILDVTRRKEAELSLAESEARFKALHNASFGGIAIHDQGRLLECNQGLSEMFGYEPSELVGMDGLLLVAEDHREMVMNQIRSGYEKPYEAVGRRKNGETFPMRLEARNIPFKGKNVRTVEFRDLTDIRRAEAEREKLREQLNQAQKMESVGRLAGGVAHDFNNMLGVILGHAELIMDTTDASLPIYGELQEIRKAAERSANLTRQLLAFARKQTIMPKILDLNDTVEGMLKMLRRLIGEDINLAWLPGKNLGSVKMDPSQIDQILANLCVNARDAISNTGRIIIETSSLSLNEAGGEAYPDALPGDYIRLSISDNGCGMDQKTIERLFEPFYTTKELGKGTGLGLATVYGIVKQNGGFIKVISQVDQGSTFHLHFPRHLGEGNPHHKESPSAMRKGHETILLVEDEPAILKMTALMLERLGYKVLAAASPAESLRLTQDLTVPIHLLMTDVVMPDMNGRELAARLSPRHPGLKCLFMSGYTADIIANHGVIDEGVNFIQKPFTLQALAARLRETFGQG